MTAADLSRLDVSAEQVAAEIAELKAKRTRDGLLAEQRHALLDLDADSAFTIPGCVCPACPPRDTEAAS
jgi:hypothetical protein